jgi:hypothetical protein
MTRPAATRGRRPQPVHRRSLRRPSPLSDSDLDDPSVDEGDTAINQITSKTREVIERALASQKLVARRVASMERSLSRSPSVRSTRRSQRAHSRNDESVATPAVPRGRAPATTADERPPPRLHNSYDRVSSDQQQERVSRALSSAWLRSPKNASISQDLISLSSASDFPEPYDIHGQPATAQTSSAIVAAVATADKAMYSMAAMEKSVHARGISSRARRERLRRRAAKAAQSLKP